VVESRANRRVKIGVSPGTVLRRPRARCLTRLTGLDQRAAPAAEVPCWFVYTLRIHCYNLVNVSVNQSISQSGIVRVA